MDDAGPDNRAARVRSAGFVALSYVVFASAWIIGSSYLLDYTIADPILRWRAELGKGLAFVLTTGLLLFFLLLAPLSSELHRVVAPVEPRFRRYRGIGIGLLLLAPLIAISIYYFTSPGVKKQTYPVSCINSAAISNESPCFKGSILHPRFVAGSHQ